MRNAPRNQLPRGAILMTGSAASQPAPPTGAQPATVSAASTRTHSATVRFPFDSPHGPHAGARFTSAPDPPRENGTM